MSYNRIIKSQNGLMITSEAGDVAIQAASNVSINPTGTVSVKGHAIGSDIQAFHSHLDDISAISSPSSGNVIKWSGSAWEASAESADATTATAPIVKTGDDLSLSLASGQLEVNGSDELAIAAGGVDTAELANSAVTNQKLASNSVSWNVIQNGAVISDRIADGAVATVNLANDAVTAAKLADDAVDSQHIAAGALDAEHYAAGSVGAAAIANDAIDSQHYADGSIDTAHLAANLTLSGPSVNNGVVYKSSSADANGDSFAVYQATSNDTPVEVSLFTLAENEAAVVQIQVAARDDTSGDKAGYTSEFVCSRGAGSTGALDSAENISPIYESAGAAAWALGVSVSTAGVVSAALTGDATNTTKFSIFARVARVAN